MQEGGEACIHYYIQNVRMLLFIIEEFHQKPESNIY